LNDAIVLLSGGIDSATALYLTKKEAHAIYSMNLLYAQASIREAEASKALAAAAQVKEHLSVSLPFYKDIQNRYHPMPSVKVSGAYVPARNIIFYGIAAAYAETLGVGKIIFGSNAEDARELPDARPQFIQTMSELLKAGTRVGLEGNTIEIVNPLIDYKKADVLKLAIELGVPLELTWSCYEDVMIPCGKCRGCSNRLSAFNQLGLTDPLTNSERSG
jgi:7-cyano-7-deazaguanine synthase